MEKDYSIKERYVELLKAIAEQEGDMEDREDIMSYVDETMTHFVEYAGKLATTEMIISGLRFRKEGQDLVDAIMNVDKKRRDAHNLAVDAVSKLNRISDNYNVSSPVPFTYKDFATPEDMGDPLKNNYFRERIESFSIEVVMAFSDQEILQEAIKNVGIEHKSYTQTDNTLEDAILSGDDDAIKDAAHQLTNNPNNPSAEIQNEQNFDAIDEYEPETK